jgi:hypothetical protein
MSSPRHSRTLAATLSLVPGWGHVYLGREAAGLLLFTLAALSLFLFINLGLMYQGEHRLLLLRISAGSLLFFWLLSLADVMRRTSPGRRRRIEEEKGRLLRAGMISYLRGELAQAEARFRECLKLDHQEVEAVLRLGVIAARSGAAGRARRWLKRARRLDLDGKWSWEIFRELQPLAARPPGKAAETPPAGPAARITLQRRKAGVESRPGPEEAGEETVPSPEGAEPVPAPDVQA